MGVVMDGEGVGKSSFFPSVCMSAADACKAAKFDLIRSSLSILRKLQSSEREKSGTTANTLAEVYEVTPVPRAVMSLKNRCRRSQNWMCQPEATGSSFVITQTGCRFPASPCPQQGRQVVCLAARGKRGALPGIFGLGVAGIDS